jgi:hypothetical protein
MATNRPLVLLAALALLAGAARAEDFRIVDARSLAAAGPSKPHTIAFADHHEDDLTDPATGLVRFEDWARAMPVQKQFLSLYPSYSEPMVDVAENGPAKPTREKLHMYVAEARFLLPKPPRSIDLTHYATIGFLERIDPKITHKPLAPAEAEQTSNPNPDRRWCDAKPDVQCIESRYELEGKLPSGIHLVNKLVENKKKIADYLQFQSELRILPEAELAQAGLTKLTGIDAPIASALEQNIFHVNQVMQFGKFLALLQPDPAEAGNTVVTAFVVLAIKSRVLENKNKYAAVPVLRNLVPGQVLVGKSSFNTGTSISAGLPSYARNQIKAVAGILEQE